MKKMNKILFFLITISKFSFGQVDSVSLKNDNKLFKIYGYVDGEEVIEILVVENGIWNGFFDCKNETKLKRVNAIYEKDVFPHLDNKFKGYLILNFINEKNKLKREFFSDSIQIQNIRLISFEKKVLLKTSFLSKKDSIIKVDEIEMIDYGFLNFPITKQFFRKGRIKYSIKRLEKGNSEFLYQRKDFNKKGEVKKVKDSLVFEKLF